MSNRVEVRKDFGHWKATILLYHSWLSVKPELSTECNNNNNKTNLMDSDVTSFRHFLPAGLFKGIISFLFRFPIFSFLRESNSRCYTTVGYRGGGMLMAIVEKLKDSPIGKWARWNLKKQLCDLHLHIHTQTTYNVTGTSKHSRCSLVTEQNVWRP